MSSRSVQRARRQEKRGRGQANTMEKLEQRVKDGDYYGALQMYKTLYSRHVNNQKVKDACDLAESSAMSLIQYGQTTAAMEMAELLIEEYNKEHVPLNEESKVRVVNINNKVLEFTDENAKPPVFLELAGFLKEAVKWSAKEGGRQRGDPALQLLLAQAYERAQDYESASKHFLHTEKPKEYATMLETWAKEGYASERDLFIARAVLQLLALENLRDANVVFEQYTKAFSDLDTPLINFLSFLLQTLERDAVPLFQMLRQKYATSLARDESFGMYMGMIGQKFYKLQPPQSGLGALMNMFGGGF